MKVRESQPLFWDRTDAGKRLAGMLDKYIGDDVVVYAVPCGGVPIGIELASKLGADLDIVVPRKITIPFNPEAGYGAVTEDGAIVLNEPLVERLGLDEEQIKRQSEQVRNEIARRSSLFRGRLDAPSVEAKTAIICDDGLASGYTMIAAVKSVQHREPGRIVVAVPVASETACDLVRPHVYELVCLVAARVYHFAVASFYRNWCDLSDEEVIRRLDGWRKQRTRSE
jgi:predicted phosphoribosyltransferase